MLKKFGIIFLIIGLVLTASYGQAKTKNPKPQQPISQVQGPFYHGPLGFTPLPPDVSPQALDIVYDFIRQNASLIAHHFDDGVPWPEALTNKPFSKHIQDDWKTRKSKTPPGMKVYLAVTPINFERTDLAPYRGEHDRMPLPGNWAGKRFNDPDVKKAYLNYVVRSIKYFHPDFLAIGIESNILISKAPEKWNDYVELNAYIYKKVKDLYPKLPVFSTIQYEHLRGMTNDAKANARYQMPGVGQLMKHSDYLALSIYKFSKDYDVYNGQFFGPALSFHKPIAVAESGANSTDVTVFGTRLPASDEDQAQFVSTILQNAARYNFKFVVNFVAIDFDELMKKLPPGSDLANIWVHNGLMDSTGRAKPSLYVWLQHLRKG